MTTELQATVIRSAIEILNHCGLSIHYDRFQNENRSRLVVDLTKEGADMNYLSSIPYGQQEEVELAPNVYGFRKIGGPFLYLTIVLEGNIND